MAGVLKYRDPETGEERVVGLPSNLHAAKHGVGGADPLTPEMLGMYSNSKIDELLRGKASTSSFLASSWTIHVAKTGSDTTGVGTEANPYLTIQKAVNSLPRVVTGSVTIKIRGGTYDEIVTLSGFTTGSIFSLTGVAGESVKVKAINLWTNNAIIYIENIEVFGAVNDSGAASIQVAQCRALNLDKIICVQPPSVTQNYGAISCRYTPYVKISNSTVSNQTIAVDVLASIVYMNQTVTGTGNTVAIRCGSGWGSNGGFVFKGGATIEGPEHTGYGGKIFGSETLLHTSNTNQTKLVSSDTTPTVNNQINWTYK